MEKILESSKGGGELSLTVKGILVSVGPIIIAVMKLVGIEMAESDYALAVQSITTIISATMILAGIVRKVFFAIKEFIVSIKI